MRVFLKLLGLFVWGVFGLPLLSHAQLLQYSNESFTPMRTNPAWGAGAPLMRGSVQYRYNATAAAMGFHTPRISGSYPLVLGKKVPMIAFSGALMQDQELPNSVFRRQEYTAGTSIGVAIGPRMLLSAGFQGHYHQENVTLNNLTTGSQYLPGRGYSPEINNGEFSGNLQNQYLSFSAGLLGTWWDSQSITPMHYLGISVYDLNEPPASFLEDAPVRPKTWVAQGAFTLYQQSNFRFRPDFLYQTNGELSSLVAGIGWGYNLGNQRNPAEFWVNTRYRVGEAAIVGASLRRDNLTFGYTYDFSVATSGSGLHHTGAHEIALRYEVPVKQDWWLNQVRINRNKKPLDINWPKWNINWPKWNINWPRWMRRKRPRPQQPERTRPARTPEPKPETTPEEPLDSPGDVEFGLIEQEVEVPEPDTVILENIVKHFYFASNQAELDSAAEQYLDSLLVSLQEHDDWLIDIEGHTDSQGDEELNQKLSRDRALSVGWYLAKNGIHRRRIRIQGMGEAEPLEDNDTAEGRANNRRVEITIYRVPPK